MNLLRVSTFMLSAIVLTGCAPSVLKQIPAGGSIPYNEIVYVENDGRCNAGEVIQIRGGSNKNDIPRKYSCVARLE